MRHLVLIFGVFTMLAGCGSANVDRAVSGGAIGAGLGTATGLVIGNPLGGFVVGGAIGAAAGLVSDDDTIDLGDPIWKKDHADSGPPHRLVNMGNETEAPDNPPSGEIDGVDFDNRFVILD